MGSPDNDMVKISRESGIKRFTLRISGEFGI